MAIRTNMKDLFLYEELDVFSKMGGLKKEIPNYITKNLNQKFPLRQYQIEALSRFFYYFNRSPDSETPIHLLFNMATGSGKTFIMAALILYLYEKGYRNFLFVVNLDNIVRKTIDNFLNDHSSKYLFNNKIWINDKYINIEKVDNFQVINQDSINIYFTTIQKLHADLYNEKENSITSEDFKKIKTVILSDEAHHGQVQTKQKELYEKPNWENTILKVFDQNAKNVLLEFTATMDLTRKEIESKYKDKIIYKYDLKDFRNDGYSKDINILQADLDRKERMLVAILLNQYRQDIAGKYGINLKPVILFKAQKTIEQSKENKQMFHHLIENLTTDEIINIKDKINIKEIKNVFTFYDTENISIPLLIKKLKTNFAPNKCISVNEDSEKEKYQILINSLEDSNNQIRAIFAVQKLNEGWDVLNLFDIVRLYESRDSNKGIVGRTTIAEAQLIGRGARYYPFMIGDNQEKFKRKYDKDLANELRILEELHYHSLNESRYISEIKQALVEEGLIDNKTIEKELKLKDSFKNSKLYKSGNIYLNKRVDRDYSKVNSFYDLGIREKDFSFKIYSMKGKIVRILTDENLIIPEVERRTRTIKIGDIPKHVVISALDKFDFFKFNSITKYIPNLKSIFELIENGNYLKDIEITFDGISEDLQNLTNREMMLAIIHVLSEIESKFKLNRKDFVGTEEFYPEKISDVFVDKTIKIEIGTERDDGQEELAGRDWYVFNANYGTSEEKAFIRLMDRMIDEYFSKKCDWIYVIRNELHFKLYNFEDGNGFSPDFVLFMRGKQGLSGIYQIFIEPKGRFLEEVDRWKEQFLISLGSKMKTTEMKILETEDYRVIGLPFYVESSENKFKRALLDSL